MAVERQCFQLNSFDMRGLARLGQACQHSLSMEGLDLRGHTALSAFGAGSQRPTDARCTEEAGLNNQAVKWSNDENVGPA
jgi:hypothetical protein